MPFDGLVLAAVRRELERELVGSRIQRVHQPDKMTLLLQLRTPGQSHQLLLSAHPQHARVHLTTRRFNNPSVPPLFCSVCRKHLEGGRVEAIVQPELERVLRLVVGVRDELGEIGQKTVVTEIMGRHSNIILVDEGTGNILDAIKRYGHAVSRYREVAPGLPYLAPPREKADPVGIPVERFAALLLERPLELPVWKALQQTFEGLSPLTAREVVYRAGVNLDLALEFCGERELVLVWKALGNLLADVAAGRFVPTLVPGPDVYADFAAVPVTHRESVSVPEGINALVDRVFAFRAQSEHIATTRNSLLSAIAHRRKRLEKRLDACRQAAADTKKAEKFKTIGEILTANLYRLPKEGTDRVVLENFYTGEPVEIQMDPRLSPSHNAQVYFKRYHKLQKGAERAQAELAELEAEAAYLEALETAVRLAETAADLHEIRDELVAAGYLRDKPATGPAGKTKARIKPQPLELKAADGSTVYIGRNNRQNDLVFRLAQPDDVWLHTRDLPGAHVVIRTGGRPVKPEVLEQAAAWAAWFSKARHGKKVPVDYTLRKYVQKPKGARPGFVTYTNEKTVLVDPRPVEE
jgi:predicted ribosome quality control (RQC) complex YloA/Tae2 family protein